MTGSLSAFDRLRALLADVVLPADRDPVTAHLGEPRVGSPAVDTAAMADAAAWTRYPTLGGTAGQRAAYLGWLARRFGVRSGRGLAVEPTPGSKQAVAVALALAGRGAVVMPNPFYPTYLAGTQAAGARPVFYRTGGDTADAVAAAVRAAGDVAAVIVCDPGNPGGEVLDADTLRAVAQTAADAGAVLVVDECYTDLYWRRRPEGYLSVWPDLSAAPGPFLVLHTLSKRSAMPGLRSGFVAGDPRTVGRYARYNRACGVSTPDPVCAVAAQLWADEAHVARLRADLSANWDIADAVLGGVPGYRRPDAGFYLWLPVPDDEDITRRLWAEHALKVMPGRYLAADDTRGNPGRGHVRIAVVHDAVTTRNALDRVCDVLTRHRVLEETA